MMRLVELKNEVELRETQQHIAALIKRHAISKAWPPDRVVGPAAIENPCLTLSSGSMRQPGPRRLEVPAQQQATQIQASPSADDARDRCRTQCPATPALTRR